jgi:predicted nucleic acid-binding protein
MVISATLRSDRQPRLAHYYRQLIEHRPIVVSFVTITELRYGALKAGWGELRRRALERDLAQLVVVQPDDRLMHVCAELRATCERRGSPLGQPSWLNGHLQSSQSSRSPSRPDESGGQLSARPSSMCLP